MEKEKENLPENVKKIVTELRDLEGQYADISYRAGTNGERGLYPKRKSVLSKISKAKKLFEATVPDYKLVYSHSWPNWFVNKK